MDGIYLINPGSLSQPRDGSGGTFCIVETSEAGVWTKIYYYEDFMARRSGMGSVSEDKHPENTVSAEENGGERNDSRKKSRVTGGKLRDIFNYSDRF